MSPSEDAIFVSDAVGQLGQDVQAAVGQALQGVTITAQEAAGIISQLVAGRIDALGQSAINSLGQLTDAHTDALGGLAHLFGRDDAPAGTWGPQIGQVHFPAMNNMGQLAKHLDDLLTGAGGLNTEAFWNAAVKAWTPTLGKVLALSPDNVNPLNQVLAKGASDAVDWVTTRIAPWMKDYASPWALAAVKAAKSVAGPLTQPFVEGFTPEFIGTLEYLRDIKEVDPEKVLETVKPLFDRAAQTGIQAHLLSALAGVDIFGIGFDFGPVAAFLGDIADYGRIIDPYIDAMTSAAIGQPAKYLANMTKRPTIPGPGDAHQLYFKGVITLDEYKALMAKHGFSDKWIDKYLQHIFIEPNYRDLLMMMESSAVSENWLFEKLRRAGYEDSDAGIYVDAMYQRYNSTYSARLFSEHYYKRRYGLEDEKDFAAALKKMNLRPETAGIAQEAAATARSRQVLWDFLKIVDDTFSKEFIDLDTYRTILEAMPGDDFSRYSRLAAGVLKKYRAVTWKRPEEQEAAFQKEVRAAVPKYLSAYAQGDMTTADLETLLVTSGLLPEIADLVLLQARQARLQTFDRKAQALGIPDARDRFIQGQMTEEDYRQYLYERGAFPGTIDLELSVATLKRDERISSTVRREVLPEYESGYALNWITEDELVKAYELAGLDDRAITIRLGLAEVKRRAAEKSALANEDLLPAIRALSDFQITEADFLDLMDSAGVAIPIQESAKALVPVLRKIERRQVVTEDDLAALFQATKVGIVEDNPQEVLATWFDNVQARRRMAHFFKTVTAPRRPEGYARE